MKHYFVLLPLLWSIVFSRYRVEACSELDISYIEHTAKRQGDSTFPQCALPDNGSGYKWWRSSTECGPFNEVADCPGSRCTIHTADSQLQRNFYYCCTSGDVTDINQDTQKSCFHINICTELVTTQEDIDHTIGFFGQLLPVYVHVYGEPVPPLEQITMRLRYSNSNQVTLNSSNSVSSQNVYSAADSSLTVWVLFIEIPEQNTSVQYATLVLSVTFGTVDQSECLTDRSRTFNIRLTRAVVGTTDKTTEPFTSTTITSTVPPTFITPSSSTTDAELLEQRCVQWIVLFVLFLVATLILSIITMITCVSLCVQRSRKQSVHSLSNHTGANGVPRQRPGTLTYNALQPSASVTPTPILNGKSLELHHFSSAPHSIKTTATLDFFSQSLTPNPLQTKTAAVTNPQPESPGDSGHYEEIPGLANKGDEINPPSPPKYSSDYICGKRGELPKIMESPSTEV